MTLINPRQLIEDAQKRKLYPLELASILHGIDSADPSTLADLTIDYSQRKPTPLSTFPIDSESLKSVAISFHKKAGTDTQQVLNNIESLTGHIPRLRIAHQVNLFPSLGVVSQFFLMNSLVQQLVMQQEVTSCQIFVIVDYDIAQDQRFRVAHIPNVQARQGTSYLSGAVDHQLFQKPMWTIAKPSRIMVKEWIKNLQMFLLQDVKTLARENIIEREPRFVEENITTLEALIWNAFERADSLVEFNAFLLSQIVNRYWEMPIVFIIGREIQPLMQNAYEFLIEQWPLISSLVSKAASFFYEQGILIKSSMLNSSLETLPFWITCNSHYDHEVCQQRVRLYASKEKHLIAYGRCERCSTDYKFDLGTYSKVDIEPIVSHGLAPRILMDNLLDAIGLGIAGGVGYLGQAEHMLVTNYVASNMNWEMPPHCLWRPKGFYYGLTECRAINDLWKSEISNEAKERSLAAINWSYTGKASFLYYLANLGFQGLLKMWDDFFRNGEKVYNVNFGQQFSPVLLTGNLTRRIDLADKLDGEKDSLLEC
jgi:hypothetical protein